MVYRIEPKAEEFYQEGLKAFLINQASLVSKSTMLPGAEIYTCGVNEKENAIAYLMAYNNSCIGYFIVEPLVLHNRTEMRLFISRTAIRGWVDASYRGRGLYQELLRAASSGNSLISDRDGTTASAYNSWLNAKGFSHRYYDQTEECFTDPQTIPDSEKFTSKPEGKRWLLVLEPVN